MEYVLKLINMKFLLQADKKIQKWNYLTYTHFKYHKLII